MRTKIGKLPAKSFASNLGVTACVASLLYAPVVLSAGNEVSTIIYSTERSSLLQATAIRQHSDVRRRACEIQRERDLPPTACFELRNSPTELMQLTEDCLRLSSSALVLPKAGSATSELCQRALEARRKDLLYAGQASTREKAPDALR